MMTTTAEASEAVDFCPLCFATNEDGSWGCTVTTAGCSNCGANGGIVRLPRWAVTSIRANASWVGKRYYPNDEDIQAESERRELLAQVAEFPGRTAKPGSEPNSWWVTQRLANGTEQSVIVVARSATTALEAARYSLTYVPEDSCHHG